MCACVKLLSSRSFICHYYGFFFCLSSQATIISSSNTLLAMATTPLPRMNTTPRLMAPLLLHMTNTLLPIIITNPKAFHHPIFVPLWTKQRSTWQRTARVLNGQCWTDISVILASASLTRGTVTMRTMRP